MRDPSRERINPKRYFRPVEMSSLLLANRIFSHDRARSTDTSYCMVLLYTLTIPSSIFHPILSLYIVLHSLSYLLHSNLTVYKNTPPLQVLLLWYSIYRLKVHCWKMDGDRCGSWCVGPLVVCRLLTSIVQQHYLVQLVYHRLRDLLAEYEPTSTN